MKRLVITMISIVLMTGVVYAQANVPAETKPPAEEVAAPDPLEPQEAMSGLYSYRVGGNVLIVDTSQTLLSDKLKRVDFIGRGTAKKNWNAITPRLAKMFEDIMKLEGVADFAVTSYQFAIQIAPRFTWEDQEPEAESLLQQVLAIVDKYITE